jgi:hypothetical protein
LVKRSDEQIPVLASSLELIEIHRLIVVSQTTSVDMHAIRHVGSRVSQQVRLAVFRHQLETHPITFRVGKLICAPSPFDLSHLGRSVGRTFCLSG